MHSMAITPACLLMARQDRARVILSSVTERIKELSREFATNYLSGSVKDRNSMEHECSTRPY